MKNQIGYYRILLIRSHLYKCEGAASMRVLLAGFSKALMKNQECSGPKWTQPKEPIIFRKGIVWILLPWFTIMAKSSRLQVHLLACKFDSLSLKKIQSQKLSFLMQLLSIQFSLSVCIVLRQILFMWGIVSF